MSLLSVNMLLMMESRHFENLNWRTLWLYPERSSISQIESTGMEREFIILNDMFLCNATVSNLTCLNDTFEQKRQGSQLLISLCYNVGSCVVSVMKQMFTELGDWPFVSCNASCLISSFYKFNIFFWYEMSPWHRARIFHSCWYVRYRKAIKIFCWLNNDTTNL